MQVQLASAGAVQLLAARPGERSSTCPYSRDAGLCKWTSMDIICVLRMFPQALRRDAQSGPVASGLAGLVNDSPQSQVIAPLIEYR
jgi:hypothetical protein